MRRLLTLLSALAGALAVVSRLRRARASAADGPLRDRLDPRAETLRRRLDEARLAAPDRDEFEAREVPVDRAEPPPADPDARRRRLHAEARATAQAMRGPRDETAD